MSESTPSELFSLGSLAWGQYWGPMGRNFEISLKIGRNAIQMHVWPVVKLTGCLLINQSINHNCYLVLLQATLGRNLLLRLLWVLRSDELLWLLLLLWWSCLHWYSDTKGNSSDTLETSLFFNLDSDDDASVEFNEAKYVPPSLSPSQTFLEWNCFLLFNSGFLRNPNFRSVWKFFMRNPWENTVYQN